MNVSRYLVTTVALVWLAGCAGSPGESADPDPVGVQSQALVGSNALDPTFGNAGLVTLSAPNLSVSSIEDLAIQADGKIVIGTNAIDPVAGGDFAIVRLLPNGSLDPSFGARGVATTPFPPPTLAGGNPTPSVAIQADGKILETHGALLTGSGESQFFSVARFNTNGSVDTSFGQGGVAKVTLPGIVATASVLAVQHDAKILVAGSTTAKVRSAPAAVVVRFNANGSLDTAFGTGGVVAPAGLGQITAVALEPDASILVTSQGTVARLSSAGVAEAVAVVGTLSPIKSEGATTFTPDGHIVGAVTAPGLGREGTVIEVVERTLTGGVVFNGPTFNWGTPGVFNAENGPGAVTVAPGGKIVTGGAAFVCPTTLACLVTQTTRMYGLAAVLPNASPPGALDPSFGAGGLVQTRFGINPGSPADSFVAALAVQPVDGKVVALGVAGTGAIALARYSAP